MKTVNEMLELTLMKLSIANGKLRSCKGNTMELEMEISNLEDLLVQLQWYKEHY